jgi:choline dehydrogenase-like flavoprotein
LPQPASEREMIPGLASDGLTTSSIYRFSTPTDVGARYRQELADSRTVRLFLYANCLEIATNSAGSCVDRIAVGTINGKRIDVTAKCYVLAAGGLEVTRLLLASNRVWTNGIGNRHDWLGRFYMCHIVHHLEVEFTSRGLVWDYEKTRDGVYCQRTLSLTEDQQRALELLNHRARIEHPPIEDLNHRNGVLSAAFLAKWVMRNKYVAKYLSPVMGTFSRGVIPLETPEQRRSARRTVCAHAGNVICDSSNVFRFSRRWLRERILSDRKLPSMLLQNDANIYTLRIDAEQAPNPDSRVSLSDERDDFGQRRLKVDWRYTDIDSRNLTRTAGAIGQALSQSGAGKVRSIPAADPKATGGHHMGTTRMAASASAGVVDANCRVHGVGNLFIASSSVFPTCSYANPTLMALGLAIRLADHLVAELSPKSITGLVGPVRHRQRERGTIPSR